MIRRILPAVVLALFLLVPFASPARADAADVFLDQVAAVLARAVNAGKMEAEDARAVYNAIVAKVEAVQEKIDAWKEKFEDCRGGDDDDETGTDAAGDDTYGDARETYKAALRKAKADRKAAKARTRLSKHAERLKAKVDRDRCSVWKALKKWSLVLRKVASKLDETTLKRLYAYAEDLKTAIGNGRITEREAFDLFVKAVRSALAAE